MQTPLNFESPPVTPTDPETLVSAGEGVSSLPPPPEAGSLEEKKNEIARLKAQISQVYLADPLEARKNLTESAARTITDCVTPKALKNRKLAALKDLVRDLPTKLGHMAEDGYSRALMAYLSTLGDAVQTGRLTGVDPEKIRNWAEADAWNVKITALLTIKKEKGVQAFAVELNRLLNLTQAVRCRGLLDEVLTRIMTNEDDLASWLSVKSQHAVNTTAKPLLELARAILAVQQATYMALGDQAAERVAASKSEEKEEDSKVQEPHLALFSTLAQLAARTPMPVLRGVELPPARTQPPEV